MQSDFDRSGLEFRSPGSFFDQAARDWKLQIDELSAVVADGMVVPIQLAIIASAVRSEPHFSDQTLVLQVAQRIVNGCERNGWQ